jgi:hypothetical protein
MFNLNYKNPKRMPQVKLVGGRFIQRPNNEVKVKKFELVMKSF